MHLFLRVSDAFSLTRLLLFVQVPWLSVFFLFDLESSYMLHNNDLFVLLSYRHISLTLPVDLT